MKTKILSLALLAAASYLAPVAKAAPTDSTVVADFNLTTNKNNIEGFWGILKRKLGCIGGMRRDRLHLFVGEIVWKFNRRKQSLKDQERGLIRLICRH